MNFYDHPEEGGDRLGGYASRVELVATIKAKHDDSERKEFLAGQDFVESHGHSFDSHADGVSSNTQYRTVHHT
jgi:hypothetical protein